MIRDGFIRTGILISLVLGLNVADQGLALGQDRSGARTYDDRGMVLIHPVVKLKFGNFDHGRAYVYSSGPLKDFSIVYRPDGQRQSILVRDAAKEIGLDYEVKSVFSYRSQSSNGFLMLLLCTAGRAIPGMHDVHESVGFVYAYNGGHPKELARLSAKLTNVTTAQKARAILRRELP